MAIQMNGYEKVAKERDEGDLFPELDPTDGVKADVWDEFHLNRFWSDYTNAGDDNCPSCHSSNYVDEEKELEVEGIGPYPVHFRRRCLECGKRWKNTREATHKYEP